MSLHPVLATALPWLIAMIVILTICHLVERRL
jgi:hypothetical protein